jgi:hypothetical protein
VRYVGNVTVLAGLGASALLIAGVGSPLIGVPLIRQEDLVDVWFAGRTEFGSEQQQAGVAPFRTARWDAVRRPGHCAIKDAAAAITKDGTVRFSAQVKSTDDGDTYCVILNFLDSRQTRLWTSSKFCTPFELQDSFTIWIDTIGSFPNHHYRLITFATREDYC